MMRFLTLNLTRSLWQGIKLSLLTLLGLGIWAGSVSLPALSAPAPSSSMTLVKQPPMEMTVSLGNKAGELKFFPNHLDFSAGKRYKLVLNNPSSQKHYFTAKDFADVIWTQKVDAGNVEIKGAIHELELRPGTEAEWAFVTLKPGTYELRCVVPGHAEAGMTGTITISS